MLLYINILPGGELLVLWDFSRGEGARSTFRVSLLYFFYSFLAPQSLVVVLRSTAQHSAAALGQPSN